jgi:hypothetical protein
MSDQPVTPKDLEQGTSLQLVYSILSIPGAILTAPYRRAFKLYTWQPIHAIRADKDSKMLVSLVKNWKEDKYAELQSVQVAVSGAVTGA